MFITAVCVLFLINYDGPRAQVSMTLSLLIGIRKLSESGTIKGH